MPIGLPDDPTRAATRAPIDRPIRLQFDDSVESIEARAENLSIGGTFVTGVDEARPAGALVRFELLLDDASIRGLAEVVWARGRVDQPGASLGLKFRFLEQRDRQQIFKLVSQHIKERLAKRHAVEIDPPAMSPSVTDGTPGDQLDPLGTDLASRAERPAAVMQRPTEEQAARAVSPDEMGLSEPPRPPMQASLLDGIDDSPEVAPAVAASGFERFEPGQQAHFDAFEAPPISSRSDALVGSRDAEASGAVEWGGMEADAEGIEPPSSEDAFAASEGVAADDAWATDVSVAGLPPTGSTDSGPPASGGPAAQRRLFLAFVVLGLFLIAAAGVLLLRDADPGEPTVPAAEALEAGLAPTDEPRQPTPADVGQRAELAPAILPADPPAEGAEIAGGAVDASQREVAGAPSDDPTPDALAEVETQRERPPVSETAETPGDDAPPPFRRLNEISWRTEGSTQVVSLATDGSIPGDRFDRFRLDGDSVREVVRLYGVDRRFERPLVSVGGPAVEQIRIGWHEGDRRGDALHVVLDLAAPSWEVVSAQPRGATLEIRLERR